MVSRREVLAVTGSAAAGLLAGCIDTTQNEPTQTDTTPEETPTTTPEGKTPDEMAVIEVAPDGNLVFGPSSLVVVAGTTVRWEWRGSGHNIAVSAKPDDSDWNGDDANLYDEGHVHEHTFTTAGEYEYYCEPHQSSGMVGSLTVTEN